ncbi:DUF7344 domain-containing protein [Natronococcus occultus]|uniref:DUF7344 domain-containing protein n=1 Tax=Natronococcus occultus SP4 TaxID=694430 RepID=L0K600_9EURY|nr:hypothetical protein [Natronococcus occultus]AGB39960.1 hypothetical protein Natoc_4268 [Natronococcus occultus SP4]
MAPGIRSGSQGTNADVSDARADAQLSDDARFYLLQSNRRREAIEYLLSVDETVRISTLARHVAAVEHGTSTAEVTSEQYQRLYVPLYQLHLPKLDEHGVIEYRKERGLIDPTPTLAEFRPYLDPDDGTDVGASDDGSQNRAGGDWYIAATAGGGLLLALATIGIVPLSGEAVGVLIIGLFLVANAVSRRQD